MNKVDSICLRFHIRLAAVGSRVLTLHALSFCIDVCLFAVDKVGNEGMKQAHNNFIGHVLMSFRCLFSHWLKDFVIRILCS